MGEVLFQQYIKVIKAYSGKNFHIPEKDYLGMTSEQEKEFKIIATDKNITITRVGIK